MSRFESENGLGFGGGFPRVVLFPQQVTQKLVTQFQVPDEQIPKQNPKQYLMLWFPEGQVTIRPNLYYHHLFWPTLAML